ncbi:MAG: hypothetical protein M3M91_03770 [Thermoproteota archaeon]|nr:hypothetical protein [Thermoproteota archaeon]
MEQIKARKYDPYDILTEYSGFLRNERPTTESKLTARKFFCLSKILVTVEDFNELVQMLRKEQHRKKELTRLT